MGSTFHGRSLAAGLGIGVLLAVGFLVVSSAAAKRNTKKPSKATAPARPPCQAPLKLNRKNAVLQRTLEGRIRQRGWNKLIERKALAVSLVDLSRPGRIYYAGLNDDHMLYAASLPKIAILLAVVRAVHEGRLEWTHTHDVRLQNMIVSSSNPDASWATDLVGLLDIEEALRDPRYCLYEEPHGGLWVGRAYRSGGANNRDPLFNISHGATARQTARFYTLLERGKLVTPHWSFRIKGLMSPPKHHHKFVGGLRGREGVAFVARKSGTWRTYHSDSALIDHAGRRYIAVALADTRHGEAIMQELIQIVDDIVMDGPHRRGRRQASVRR